MVLDNELVEQLHQLLDPIAAEENLIVDSVAFNERHVPALLKITVDSATGTESASLNQIAELSRQFSDLLDKVDPIESEYLLEVSTPGAESNLTKPRHYQRNLGRKIVARLRDGNTIEGTLEEADESGFTLRTPTEALTLEYDNVRRARPRLHFGGERH